MLRTESSSFDRIVAITCNTFREALRDRILYNLVLFVLLLIFGAVFISELSAAQETKIIIDLGLSAMLIFGTFIAIFVGVGVVYKEIERKTVFAILSKPVGRGEFIVGKYLGMCLTLLVNVGIMGIGLSLALIYVSHGLNRSIAVIWPATLLIYLELIITTAVALLFSSFSTLTLSAMLSFFVFLIGHFSTDLKSLALSTGSSAAKYLFAGLYYLLPNFSNYSFITSAAHGQLPSTVLVAGDVVYAVVYVTVLLSAASLTFTRRNFK